jgi:hypothetical protein
MKRATPKRAEQDAMEFGSLDRNDVEAKLLFHSGLVLWFTDVIFRRSAPTMDTRSTSTPASTI